MLPCNYCKLLCKNNMTVSPWHIERVCWRERVKAGLELKLEARLLWREHISAPHSFSHAIAPSIHQTGLQSWILKSWCQKIETQYLPSYEKCQGKPEILSGKIGSISQNIVDSVTLLYRTHIYCEHINENFWHIFSRIHNAYQFMITYKSRHQTAC